MEEKIQKAIEILITGGIVVFPTDTAYGVGCRINDEIAIKRLYKLRRRPKEQASPILVNSIEMAQKYLLPITDEVNKLMKKYWPGALTIILACREDIVPEFVRGGGKTLGVRWPNHPITQKLIKGVGMPILGPSANFHLDKTPYCFADLNSELIKKVDFVLEGECLLGVASTVIDCSQRPWKILRNGALDLSV